MELHHSIQKAPFCPLSGVSCELNPLMYHSCTYLQVYYMIRREKNLFNYVPNFKIRKQNFQVIQRFAPYMIFMRVLCTDKDVKKGVAKFFAGTPSVDFAKVILDKGLKRMRQCVESGGRYFEKEPKAWPAGESSVARFLELRRPYSAL